METPPLPNFLVINMSGLILKFISASVCCLHEDESQCGDILPFNLTSLGLCQVVLDIRRENHLKYANVILPQDTESKKGYNIECYRKFTALGKKYRGEIKRRSIANEESPKNQLRLRSKETIKVDQRGILPKICIICKAERKKFDGVDQLSITASTKNLESSLKRYALYLEDEDICYLLSGGGDCVSKEVRYHAICRTR